MSKRVALVTGGTRGIGAATAARLQAAGYAVAVNYARDSEAARAFSARTDIPAYQFDVADPAACEAGVARIVSDLGPVDVLINNAGITRDAMMHKLAPDRWSEVIRVNLDGCFNMCRAVIGPMRERGFGRIVNLGSINGQTGQLGQVAYAASKAGLQGFTRALAREGAARNVTVNVVAPGYIDTDMVRAIPPEALQRIVARIPVGRLGTAEDVARAVLFLVSDDAGFITGATLSVNGGQLIC